MTEAAIQKAVAKYLDETERLFKAFVWFHPPNSIRCSISQAAAHKAYGMKAGIPDCVILGKDKTVLIELKPIQKTLSEAQKRMHSKLKALSIPTYLVRAKTPTDAVNQIESILEEEGLLI